MASDLEPVPVNSQKHDPAWKHCQMYKSGDKVQLKCIYCGKMFKGGGIHRIKEHLAGQKGNASSCLRVQPDVRLLMQESLNGVVVKKRKKQKLAEEITNFNSGETDSFGNQSALNTDALMLPAAEPIDPNPTLLLTQEEEGTVSSKRGTSGRRKKGCRVRKGSNALALINDNPYDDSKRVNHQVSLAIGRFLFDVGVPPDAANSIYFQPMIDAISSQGPGVIGPSYHDLRSWILKNSVQEVKTDVDQIMSTWGKSGCSVLIDESTSETGKMFLNFSVYCPEGLMFLKSIDAINIINSIESLYTLFKEIIEEIGVRNVLQIVTNNKHPYIEVGKQITETFPTIFWTPCATHCVDSMLSDFRQLEWISTILEQARSISRFIYNHSHVLNMMRRYTFGLDIVVVGPTPASTDFSTLKRMVNVKHNLQSMVTSEEWMECSYSKKEEGYTTLDYISNPSFWSMCTVITHLTDPLLRLLRIVSGKKRPGMGYVYAGVYRAKEAIKKELVDNKDYMVYWNIIDRRWEQLHRHPLHTAGFYLNPKFFYSTEGDIHLQIRSSVYDCVERLVPDTTIQDKIVKETTSYREATGDFGRKIAVRGRESLLPAEWWSTYGGACPNLARLAIRILSQTCSLVGCKPNMIPFQQVHETRNYVEHQRLSDIVFVQYNMRLKQMFLNKEEDNNPDPISYENIKSVEAWVTEREMNMDDVGRSDWMTVDPPLGNVTVLGPQVDDFEALGEGFDDHEIFIVLKDREDENGENVHKVAPKFENLAPATAHTEETVQKFLDLPEFERTFKSECHSTQGSSSNMQTSTGSKMTRSVAKFNFADLHDVISGTSAIVKKEKGAPALPKAPAPTPSKSTGSGKKRKALEILDLTLDDSNPAEVMNKLAVMVDTAAAQISKFVEGERSKFEKASLAREKNFKEHERALRQTIQELTTKVTKLEEESLKWRSEKQELMDQHAADLDDLAIDSKRSAAVSVLQARIALVKEDPATWDVTGWKEAVFRLTGVHPDQEAGEEDPGKEDPVKDDPVKEDGATSKEV